MPDPFELARFVDAQSRVYDSVLDELRAGRKRTHWIWYVFPQLAGLGSSPASARFAISGIDEARAYLAHPVLGPRLRECSRIVGELQNTTAENIFGWPDYLKVRSSMTLFARVTTENAEFLTVLDKFYAYFPEGREDPVTVTKLAAG